MINRRQKKQSLAVRILLDRFKQIGEEANNRKKKSHKMGKYCWEQQNQEAVERHDRSHPKRT